MRQLQHARLMPCLSSFVSGTELWMVEPLCGYGSTKDLLAAHFTEGLPERAIALILRDVVRALDYLHSQGYIHRSVKWSGQGCCAVAKSGRGVIWKVWCAPVRSERWSLTTLEL